MKWTSLRLIYLGKNTYTSLLTFFLSFYLIVYLFSWTLSSEGLRVSLLKMNLLGLVDFS